MTSRLTLERMLMILLGAGSLAVILAAIPIISLGGLLSDADTPRHAFWYAFGLGHPNQLLNTAGIAAVAHAVWVSRMLGCKRRIPRIALPLAVAGLVAVAILAVGQSRRGVAVAAIAGVMAILVCWLWHRRRPLAIAVISAFTALILGAIAYAASEIYSNSRMERGLIYLAHMEFGWDCWWLGHGHYGSRLIQFSTGEHAVAYSSLGIWGLHAHSELLDAWVDGGVVALLSCIGLGVVGWIAVLRREPSPEKDALLMLIAGAAIIALIDNAYSRLVGAWWLACVAGLILHNSGTDSGPSRTFNARSIKIGQWATAIAAALASTTVTSGAFMHREALPSVHVRTVLQMREPELLTGHVTSAITMLEGEGDWPTVDRLIEVQRRRIGPTFNVLIRQSRARMNAQAPLSHAIEPLTILSRSALFDPVTHRAVHEFLNIHPEFSAAFDPQSRYRAARWGSRPDLPHPDIHGQVPTSSIPAARRLAELAWLVSRDPKSPGLGIALEAFVDTHPTARGAVDIAMRFAIQHPGSGFTFTPDRAQRMARAAPVSQSWLSGLATSEQAARIRPYLETAFPTFFNDWRAGTMTRGAWTQTDEGIRARCEVMRLFGMLDDQSNKKHKAGANGPR